MTPKVETPIKFAMSRPDPEIATMFMKRGYVLTPNVKDADVVVFPGGADISPMLYGEPRLPHTNVSLFADTQDIACLRQTVPSQIKVGICRGAQFLNVMVGNGTLWQHVDNHTLSGGHDAFFTDSEERAMLNTRFRVTSTHHQMMKPGYNGQVFVVSKMVCSKQGVGVREDTTSNSPGDPEMIVYATERAFCCQPHPEIEGTLFDPLRKNFFDIVGRMLDGTL